jgi:hypothetical protein
MWKTSANLAFSDKSKKTITSSTVGTHYQGCKALIFFTSSSWIAMMGHSIYRLSIITERFHYYYRHHGKLKPILQFPLVLASFEIYQNTPTGPSLHKSLIGKTYCPLKTILPIRLKCSLDVLFHNFFWCFGVSDTDCAEFEAIDWITSFVTDSPHDLKRLVHM